VNVVSSNIRIMQIFAGVREIWGLKEGVVGQKSDFSTFVQQHLENSARYDQSYY